MNVSHRTRRPPRPARLLSGIAFVNTGLATSFGLATGTTINFAIALAWAGLGGLLVHRK